MGGRYAPVRALSLLLLTATLAASCAGGSQAESTTSSTANGESATASQLLDQMNLTLTEEPIRIDISHSGTFEAFDSSEQLELDVTQYLDAGNHRGRQEARGPKETPGLLVLDGREKLEMAPASTLTPGPFCRMNRTASLFLSGRAL